jgi:flavin-binding protein dodecin
MNSRLGLTIFRLIKSTIFQKQKKGNSMSDQVYKIIEIVGTSPKSIEDAVNNALEKASKTVRGMSWLQVVETRGHIEKQKLIKWQVVVKVGFSLEE